MSGTIGIYDTEHDFVLPRGNYLKPNGLGGYIISYSAIGSWSRCQMQKYYNDRARNDENAPQPEQLSASTYGTVVHHALHVYERLVHEGRPDALDVAQRTFKYYWHPANLHELGVGITTWVPRTTWAGLNDRGRLALAEYAELRSRDKSTVLALEYEFAVPLQIDGRTHTLHGFIDRLTIDRLSRKPFLAADDFKTGKQQTYLRQNQQGTLYAYATAQPEFWWGWDQSGLSAMPHFDAKTIGDVDAAFRNVERALYVDPHEIDPPKLGARKFRWINMQDVKFVDGGWRNDRDYARMALMVDAYVRGCEAEVYSLSPSGDHCNYCAFKGVCGGVGLSPEEAGGP